MDDPKFLKGNLAMADLSSLDQEQLLRRISRDIVDGYDEELEMEIEDHHPLPGRPVVADDASKEYRRYYFTELFRLQAELIKLQDWVVAKGLKLVVIFEGRDAAGKGGVIKRVTQRLNPRVCRAVALPAPTERERSQWYFQRYVAHLPAGGEVAAVPDVPGQLGEEVGVEREHDVRLGEVVGDVDRRPERPAGALVGVVAVARVPLHPLGLCQVAARAALLVGRR